MADDGLFRKAALDKLASPERLDILMSVWPPQDLVAKIVIVGLIIAGLGYGFFGSSTIRVPGKGMIRGGGGLQKIQASGAGTLVSLQLSNSQRITVDQLIGTIQLPGGEQNTEQVIVALNLAMAEESATKSLENGNIARAQGQIAEARILLENGRRRHADKKKCVDMGDCAAVELRPIQAEIDGKLSEIDGLEQQIRTSRSRIADAESKRIKAEVEVSKVTKVSESTTEVRSTVSGVVLNVLKRPGDRVSSGDVLAEVEVDATGAALEVEAYVPQSFGRQINPEQIVQVTVNGIKREEYGFLKGKVRHFYDGLITGSEVAKVLKESEPGPASYRLIVALLEDPATQSKYAWSTGKGPPQELSGGVGVQVEVEVGTRRPISQILPTIRGWFGI